MQQVIDYTYLPWENQDVSGVICWVCLVLGALLAIGCAVVRHSKLGYGVHVAPFWTFQVYGYALLVNTALFSLFFWYAAIAAGALFSTACVVGARGVQNKAYYDEKNGKWGLSPDLREVRGELFSDLPPEEQIKQKQQVDASFRKIKPLPFYLITLAVPFLIMLILYGCGAGYIFVPHAL